MSETLTDLTVFAPKFFKIRTKGGTVEPYIFNRAQLYIHQRLEAQRESTGRVRALILKGRQQGCSTYVQARFCHKVITSRGKKAFILTHEVDATQNLFEITKRYVEHLPQGLIPQPDKFSHNKLYFDALDSGYSVGTAGNKSTGRSQTIQLFHGSEVGFWDNANELAKGALQTVSNLDDTEIILESTANGIGNYFYQRWQDAMNGRSDYQAIFVPWYWQQEYRADSSNLFLLEDEQELLAAYAEDGLTLEHMAWRRAKIAEFSGDDTQRSEQFSQEYPMSAQDAFINPVANRFINSPCVMRARKAHVESEAPLIIGVDPAISDNDRCVFYRRRGRVGYGMEIHYNLDTMQIAGRLRKIIETERPTRMFIDCIGIGAGVVDRLKEQGFDCVEGIAVSRSASDPDKFKNLRAELWWEMREWLMQDAEVQIPDDDNLHGELTSLGFKYDSSGRLQIESKDDLKKRGMRSCDLADAKMLTFAGGAYAASSGFQANFMHKSAFDKFT